MLEPSSSEESDVDGDEPGFAGAAGGGPDGARPGRPIPVLGGRVAGFGFGYGGLAGALNSGGVSTSVSTASASLTPSSTSSMLPPSVDQFQQRSHSLCTGISYLLAHSPREQRSILYASCLYAHTWDPSVFSVCLIFVC